MLPKWGTHSGATFLRNLFSFKNENRVEISISELETDDSKQFTWSLQTIPLVAFVLWRFWGYYTWLVRSPLAGATPNLIRNTFGPTKAGTEAPHFRIQKTSLRLFFPNIPFVGLHCIKLTESLIQLWASRQHHPRDIRLLCSFLQSRGPVPLTSMHAQNLGHHWDKGVGL